MTAPPRQTMLATAPVSKLIWTFAIPAILSQVVNSMHNIVDQTFLGWGIGDLAIAATNIAFPLSTLTTALAALIGMGGAAGFSLDLGKKQARSARKNWGNAIVLSVGLGCLLAVLAVAFLEPMLYLFGATEAMMIYAVPYARIISMGLPFAIFSMAMAHFIRADGSPKFSSGVLLSGAIFNMIFDRFSSLPVPWASRGCSGHGAGTGTLQLSGPLLSGAPAPHGDPGAGGFPSICWYDQRDRRAGGAIFFNHVIMTAAQVILMNMLRTYGAQSVYGSEIAIAGSGAVGKVMIVFLSCVIGIALGCQPIFGFNYGSKRYDRVIEAYRKALRYGTTLAVIAFLCIQLFPRQILSIFGSEDPLFYEFSIHYIRIYLLMTFVNAFQPITSNFFTSIGKAKLGFWMALVRQGLLLIPLLLLLPLALGMDGVLWAGPISDGVAAVLVLVLGAREVRRLTVQQEETP
ncbi:MAG: MATE family efflux transporter [Evtepia gabavorous]